MIGCVVCDTEILRYTPASPVDDFFSKTAISRPTYTWDHSMDVMSIGVMRTVQLTRALCHGASSASPHRWPYARCEEASREVASGPIWRFTR
jgi:hypothetical protein